MSNNLSTSEPPRLLDRVRARIRVRHYSLRTETAYLGWVKRFILFHDKRHQNEMGKPEVEAFLSHLAVLMREETTAADAGAGAAGPQQCFHDDDLYPCIEQGWTRSGQPARWNCGQTLSSSASI